MFEFEMSLKVSKRKLIKSTIQLDTFLRFTIIKVSNECQTKKIFFKTEQSHLVYETHQEMTVHIFKKVVSEKDCLR